MKYGVIYTKLIPKEDNLSWIKHCHIYESLPQHIMDVIKEVVTYINTKYKDDIIIPMGLNAQIGCVVNPDKVDRISTSIYNMYCGLLQDIPIEPCVRLVYSIGDIENVDVISIHYVGNDEVMVRVGRYLDESDETNFYKI